ncbi:MAG: MFS transporter [Chlamydiales bacterium]|nr:MFS transporter [Chlamydiia bacterium]MCP5507415.1 MFS transporter [Chlamydiales bacterium]
MSIKNGTFLIYRNFFVVWCGHLLMDLMLGVWPVFKTLARLDLTKAGLIAGCGMFVGEGLQLIFGVLSDRGHHKRLIACGLLLMAGVAFFAYAQSYLFLFLLILLAYLGSSAFHPAAVGLIGQWFESSSGVFVSLFFAGGTLGAAMSQSIFSATYTAFEGKTWILMLPVVVIGVALMAIKTPGRGDGAAASLRDQLRGLRPHLRNLGSFFTLQVLLQTLLLSMIFLLPDILRGRGFPDWFALGGAHLFFVSGTALFSVPAGHFADRYGARHVLFAAIAFSGLFLYLFLMLSSIALPMCAVLLFFLGGAMGVGNPVIVASGSRCVGPELRGLAGGILMGGATCVASLGMMATSGIAALFSDEPPAQALQVMGILYLVAMLVVICSRSIQENVRMIKAAL